ncbi:aryl-sulfate sulfotransferase [Paraburkholderia fungorum]|uniref:aryl-sulfate sulfotransferase n=1 Tax=Paraburkholderia fungorum TaxID=134537 RepID=UPI0038BDA1DD
MRYVSFEKNGNDETIVRRTRKIMLPSLKKATYAAKCMFFGCLAVAAVNAFATPSVIPTGVTASVPGKAYDCDVLFTGADHKTYLIDIKGNVVKQWDVEGFPARIVEPGLVNGKKGVLGAQLSAAEVKDGPAGTGVVPGQPALYRNKSVGLVDWEGKTIWQWGNQAPGGAARQHHDWAVLPNGHMLILANSSYAIPGFGKRVMLDDVICEVDAQGNIVWTWKASDHLNEFGFTPAQLSDIKQKSAVDYLHTNDMQVLGPNRWEKAGDSRFAQNNIMISSRDSNFTAIISRETGKVVWRIGPDYPSRNDFRPEITPRPVDQISGQHDAHMIPKGLPGAGNILLFDNQGEAGYPPVELEVTGGSRVLEINPVSKEIVWEYTGASSGDANWSFFSPFISSAQRLPNGNTLIDEGVSGRFFQVTPQGEIVWEYVSPFKGEAPVPPTPGHPKAISNWVYRIQGVPLDWVPSDKFSTSISQN